MVRSVDQMAEVADSFAHPSILATKSRTVHAEFSTPAAIAGVHRIAMLVFTKL
jgi:hypothetical protein